MWTAETVDGSDDEAEEGEYYNAKASKKKEKKRQDREAQRQVQAIRSSFLFHFHVCLNIELLKFLKRASYS